MHLAQNLVQEAEKIGNGLLQVRAVGGSPGAERMNAIDRLDFGNLASEAAHYFEPGYTPDQMPLMGTGTVGASAGQTYRNPSGACLALTKRFWPFMPRE